MSDSSPRSVLTSVVGWAIVAILAFWLIGIVIGTIYFMVRFLVWIVVLALLITVYVKLKDDD